MVWCQEGYRWVCKALKRCAKFSMQGAILPREAAPATVVPAPTSPLVYPCPSPYPFIARRMNAAKSGTVKAVSPCAGL